MSSSNLVQIRKQISSSSQPYDKNIRQLFSKLCLITELHKRSTIYFSVLFRGLFPSVLLDCIILHCLLLSTCFSCIVLFGVMTTRWNKYDFYYCYCSVHAPFRSVRTCPPPQKRAGKMAKSSITQLCFIPDCAVFQNSDSGKAKQLNKKTFRYL